MKYRHRPLSRGRQNIGQESLVGEISLVTQSESETKKESYMAAFNLKGRTQEVVAIRSQTEVI